jgi:hypothetical protein
MRGGVRLESGERTIPATLASTCTYYRHRPRSPRHGGHRSFMPMLIGRLIGVARLKSSGRPECHLLFRLDDRCFASTIEAAHCVGAGKAGRDSGP